MGELGELVILVVAVAAWIGWTVAFVNNPPWGTGKVYWGGVVVISILVSVAVMWLGGS